MNVPLDIDYRTTCIGRADFDVDLYHQSLALRKRVLVDQFKWPLVTLGDLESDQYDTLFAHHIVATKGGCAIGTIRLLPCSHHLFGSTYMILDAHRGRLPGMPTDLLEAEITDPGSWEASRLAICSSIPKEQRNLVLSGLVQAASEHIRANGGNRMLGLMRPVFIRILNNLGFSVSQIGPTRIQADGAICVINYDF
ncbi:N-acyl-L-homoserine lactone synthetase (plasmid) [Phaeobacter piscinae]|nr:N-acyl-L-homoserine lactone synthetase [Phaeobacter piscinae]